MNRVAPELLIPIEVEAEPVPSFISELFVLTKARLTMLVVITTFVGFCLATGPSIDLLRLVLTLAGTALVAASAQTFNQVIEQDFDRLMERTRNRPLPAGRMGRAFAARLGLSMGITGAVILAAFVNGAAAVLAIATLAIYLAAYTPLKRKTPWCIPVGAVAGAIPPMIGAVAASPQPGWAAWVLFAVLFTWQMPHFLAIAWMYREEYSGANFVMLRPSDQGGMKTAVESLVYTGLLAASTLAPIALGVVHPVYSVAAVVLNVVMFFYAIRFLVVRNRPNARSLFFASIIYLPIILGVLVFARV